MANIQVLGFEIANLIAAGEVVDRPASVLKELLENAIDAGATRITAEIRRGGVSLIRVTDNGCGMTAEDLPVAIRRHATSKIRTAEDLAAIGTLGFRGEALAAISAVSEIRILSKTKEAEAGVMLTATGGAVVDVSEVGAADGTTVVVENLFENVPARRKFLKKDATETMASAAVVEKIAMSRPDISFELITDGTTRFKTAGDGNLKATLFALHGKEFAARLLPVRGGVGGVQVSGFIGTSDNVRQNRNHQNMFINGRYVKSKTVMAALEKAYTSYIAPERFPVAALFLTVNPSAVDVNVHPAKLEVKFSDERVVFEAVYYAVRSALEENVSRPEWQFDSGKKHKNPLAAFVPIGEEKAHQIAANADLLTKTETKAAAEPITAPPPPKTDTSQVRPSVSEALASLRAFREQSVAQAAPFATGEAAPVFASPAHLCTRAELDGNPNPPPTEAQSPTAPQAAPQKAEEESLTTEKPPYRIVGEVFSCYVIVEQEKELLLIDKHAAHERILFERLKARQQKDGCVGSQSLLLPLTLTPTREEFASAEEYRAEIEAVGFAYQTKAEDCSVDILAVPDAIGISGAQELFVRMLDELTEGAGNPAVTEAARLERALYRVACRAAIKGGKMSDAAQIEWLVREIMALPDITVCPHGRPVAIRMTKTGLDRQFDRIM